ncbi:hypothetical protein Tco_0648067 [Tanacetum coccineum]
MSAKDTIVVQRYGLSAMELNEFLSSYPIPSEYDVIFPTSTQTIFDTPPGYVGLNGFQELYLLLKLMTTYLFIEGSSSQIEVTADSGESPKAGVFVVHPWSVAARIKERKCKTRGGSARPLVKRKLASGSSSSRVVRHLDNQMDLELLDLHDRCYARHAVVDNVVNRRALRVFGLLRGRISGEADVIKARERSREEEYEGLRAKCKAAMAEFD